MSRFYLWVLAAIFAGGLLGHFSPGFAVKLQPVGEAFIALIKMLIAPVIFLTVVLGVANVADIKKVGRVGGKALLYFELISTLALMVGLVVVKVLRPGGAFHVDPRTLDGSSVARYTQQAHDTSAVSFILHIVPKTFVDAFTGNGDLLQVLLLALLFGFSLSKLGESARPVVQFCDVLSKVFFSMIGTVMKLAPIGAGASMAFTIGAYGVSSLGPLLKLMGSFYLACGMFVLGGLGLVARLTGFSILRFLRYIRAELFLVLGTSSSESALVPLMQKLEALGCSKSVVGLVVPSGYSFNLDGTNIYLTMAALFVAQALDIDLTTTQELTLLAVAMLTSKGASGVTGAGFITLAATLAVVPSVPVAGLSLILGIDRFMSEARAITNVIGNGVASIVVARWENELDRDKLDAELRGDPKPLLDADPLTDGGQAS
ncbi:C4-dicarboxylate transporter DctA [Myxococcus sp. K15C18031901]|uniref:C4-dicarboxylate transporter DctA n=1 Tax=Myxococcus dinghuensis TaxID=2906761 RepID=UPI0020A7DD09|nr:C4-dicarboxylate transporter DctA [Myxococcus dinghuensis]MCP3098126.1 C4-dicarboxylate transporter DctA [Myxococcus dinghuensis]